MAKIKLQLWGYRCERCGHEWIPHDQTPRICPKCKSPYWDRPRKGSEVAAKPRLSLPEIQDVARTPDIDLISIQGLYRDQKTVEDRPTDQYFKTSQILNLKPPSFISATKLTLYGRLNPGGGVIKEKVVAEINLKRKAQRLGPLPAGFVCEAVDSQRSFPPRYRLVWGREDQPQ